MYLKCGRYSDAERVYRADLKRWRNNGWSLYGLSRALEMQGKHEQAAQIKADYERVWQMADEPTKTSCRCIPVT
jgi:tetratricopeptide (TPR) repeat protein